MNRRPDFKAAMRDKKILRPGAGDTRSLRAKTNEAKVVYGVSSAHVHAKRQPIKVTPKPVEVSKVSTQVTVPFTSVDASKLVVPKKPETKTETRPWKQPAIKELKLEKKDESNSK
jgi:hypothetical protein